MSSDDDNNKAAATSFATALVAGGCAGTSVDVALFPIDTLKTRMQSPQGFIKAGGFRGIYNGLGAAAVGSAPGAALFFSSYEVSERALFCYIAWMESEKTPKHRIHINMVSTQRLFFSQYFAFVSCIQNNYRRANQSFMDGSNRWEDTVTRE